LGEHEGRVLMLERLYSVDEVLDAAEAFNGFLSQE
jgi:hypothetical protein